MAVIIDTTSFEYIHYCKLHFPGGRGQYNGAYFYSKEIVQNIIPNVKTDRPWDTLGMRFLGSNDHSIVFIHHNLNHDKVYDWLKKYHDLVLVCSTPATYEWAKNVPAAYAVKLPLSIDVEYVSRFKAKKTKDVCYSGNRWAFKRQYEKKLPYYVDYPQQNLSREELLKWVAPYRRCYAIGRCAIEARCLGCEILPFYDPLPDPDYWQVLDNRDAAKILQEALDQIDGN